MARNTLLLVAVALALASASAQICVYEGSNCTVNGSFFDANATTGLDK